ncbi:MAG: stage II sporulation protein P [Ruminococcaceae bacterium]|nr:stage II sporulation protein P [Oscillospiraceae bacterium]
MKCKKLQFVLSCAAFFSVLGLCGSTVHLLASSTAFLPNEAMFVCAAPSASFDLSLYSALPLALTEADTSPHLVPEVLPTPTASKTDVKIFSPEPATDGDTLLIKNSTSYAVDTDALLNAPIPLSDGQPKVLIVHTHTSEAYTQSAGYTYTPSDAYRTEDPAYNICRVGAALAESLEANGITAIHDTTSHDYPSYSGCYNRSLETIEKNLTACPTVDVVIDLHRDAIAGTDGEYLKTAAEIDGQSVAQALVVVGTDAGGLTHSSWQKNLSLGLKLQKTMCDLYPGLARPLHLRTERFNGHASPGALLIEIGSNGNTLEEALCTAELVGKALAETLLPLMP